MNITQYYSNIKVVVNKMNLGFLKNCNNAANSARGKYFVFLNNDTNVQTDWLASMVETMENDGNIGLVGSMLLYPNGKLQEAGGIVWRDGSGHNFGRSDLPGRPQYNYMKEVDYISGASIMVRSELWNNIGGFDERFTPAYYEDTDLAFEIRKRGYKVIYQPLSRVVHFEGVSHGKETDSGVKAYQVTNQKKFVGKWHNILEKENLSPGKDIFIARDRSMNRNIVLFIDHYIPRIDQDAGSRSTFQYLMLMVDMGYRVKFIGDNFEACEPYITSLEQKGIEVLYGSWYADNWDKWIKQNSEYINYVYLSRPNITTKYIDFIKHNTQAKILYCGHDLHYLREQRRLCIEGTVSTGLCSEEWKKIETYIARSADVSYFFSDHEVIELKKEVPEANIQTLPLFLYDNDNLVLKNTATFDERKGLLFVGGFSHTPNKDAATWFIKDVFPYVLSKLPGIVFTIIGSNIPEELLKLGGKNVKFMGRVSDAELLQHYNMTRLVVAPLRYGAGVKGKIVEAIHHGVPVITTSVGIEGIRDPEHVISVADRADEIADNIIEIYNDKTKWLSEVSLLEAVMENNFAKEIAEKTLKSSMPFH